MKYIKWSLESLQDGFHPSVGPDNEPLPKGSMMEKVAGTPLTPDGFKGVLWAIQGDHEMYSNVLGLGHWNNKFPCWECNAQQPLTKGKECPKGLSFKILRENEQKFVSMTHQEALAKGSSMHPLFTIEGLSTKMVRHDGLHVGGFAATCVAPCPITFVTWMAKEGNLSSPVTDCPFSGPRSRSNTGPKKHRPD